MASETGLTKVDALRAYARMMHHLSADYLGKWDAHLFRLSRPNAESPISRRV